MRAAREGRKEVTMVGGMLLCGVELADQLHRRGEVVAWLAAPVPAAAVAWALPGSLWQARRQNLRGQAGSAGGQTAGPT